MKNYKLELKNTINKRNRIFNKKEAIWKKYFPYNMDDNFTNREFEYAEAQYLNDKRIIRLSEESTQLRTKVLYILNKKRKRLSVEDILTALISVGDAPSLLYDDNGHFAVSSEGTQNISLSDDGLLDNFSGYWKTPKTSWKKTIKEAVYWYLDDYFRDSE